MLSNLYMLPFIFYEPIDALDIWHSSNTECQDYLLDVDEYLYEPTAEERKWIKSEYNSRPYMFLREEYVKTSHELKHERDFQKRGQLLDKLNQFLAQHTGEPPQGSVSSENNTT